MATAMILVPMDCTVTVRSTRTGWEFEVLREGAVLLRVSGGEGWQETVILAKTEDTLPRYEPVHYGISSEC